MCWNHQLVLVKQKDQEAKWIRMKGSDILAERGKLKFWQSDTVDLLLFLYNLGCESSGERWTERFGWSISLLIGERFGAPESSKSQGSNIFVCSKCGPRHQEKKWGDITLLIGPFQPIGINETHLVSAIYTGPNDPIVGLIRSTCDLGFPRIRDAF